ncbi:hypothetical protein DERF_009898 [Dermatophagoides farinae]|uniref:Uncharacterized protein n=1 Tax=Dermatophagoides farinae TaxID=6954 RepID=A0A922HXI7_DERFA|nr:hypothetical protein DERF_009898 [Dermatophagoides farinae]
MCMSPVERIRIEAVLYEQLAMLANQLRGAYITPAVYNTHNNEHNICIDTYRLADEDTGVSWVAPLNSRHQWCINLVRTLNMDPPCSTE